MSKKSNHRGELDKIISLTKAHQRENDKNLLAKPMTTGPTKLENLRNFSINNPKNKVLKNATSEKRTQLHQSLENHTRIALGMENSALKRMSKGKNIQMTQSPFKRCRNLNLLK